MKTNPILKEIRETRDRLAEETGMDLRRLFAIAKQQEQAAKARGTVFIPVPEHCATVREDTPPYGKSGKEASP